MLRSTMCGVALIALVAGTAAANPAADSAAKAAGSMKAEAMKAAGTMKAGAAKTAGGTATKMKTGQDVVVLETELGEIVIRLAEADAPKTVANFRKLVASKFYDGTCFHRVIPGFMIQGGDPNSKNADPSDDGIGGPGYTIPAEIKLKHLRGSVATARQGDQVNPRRESSGSQFFIDLGPQPSLDAGGYTVFGEVVQGMETVDKIGAMGNDATLLNAGGGGKNPQKKALIKRAYLAPMSRFEKGSSAAPAAAATPAAPMMRPAATPVPADTTKK